MRAPRHPYRLGGWMLAVFVSLTAAIVAATWVDLAQLRISSQVYIVAGRIEVLVPVFELALAEVDDEGAFGCPLEDVTDDERDILDDESLSDDVKTELLLRERNPCIGVANTAACLDAELGQYVALTEQGMSFDDAIKFVTAARLGDIARPRLGPRRRIEPRH